MLQIVHITKKTDTIFKGKLRPNPRYGYLGIQINAKLSYCNSCSISSEE